MLEDREFDRIFLPSVEPASAFLAMFAPPTVLVYETDERGMWFTLWFVPFLCGASVGIWIRSDMRRSKAAYFAVQKVLDFALSQWPVLVAVTKDAAVARLHTHLGFCVAGQIPKLLDNGLAFVTYLTRELFSAKKGG